LGSSIFGSSQHTRALVALTLPTTAANFVPGNTSLENELCDGFDEHAHHFERFC